MLLSSQQSVTLEILQYSFVMSEQMEQVPKQLLLKPGSNGERTADSVLQSRRRVHRNTVLFRRNSELIYCSGLANRHPPVRGPSSSQSTVLSQWF